MRPNRHSAAPKHVIRYIVSYPDAGTCFTEKGELLIEGYSDSDNSTDPETRQSITGGLILASGKALTWARQKTASHSSTEAEHIAADSATRTLVWLLRFADELSTLLVTLQQIVQY